MEINLKYTSDRQRFEVLKQIESAVQSRAQTPAGQAAKRRKVMMDNPDIFYALYHDYELSDQRQAQLSTLAEQCIERLSLNPEMADTIASFRGKTIEEKVRLCEKVGNWISHDSGISLFNNGHTVRVKVNKEREDAHGYSQELGSGQDKLGATNLIWINQADLEQADTPSGIMRTLFHELLHSTQTEGTTDFFELSQKYYADPQLAKKNPKWHDKAFAAYKNQPCEKEAHFFGSRIENRLINSLTVNKLLNKSAIHAVAQKLTGKSDCSWKQEQGRLIINFSTKVNPKFSAAAVQKHFGYLSGPNPALKNRLDIPFGPDESIAGLRKRLQDGVQNIQESPKKTQQILQDASSRSTPFDNHNAIDIRNAFKDTQDITPDPKSPDLSDEARRHKREEIINRLLRAHKNLHL